MSSTSITTVGGVVVVTQVIPQEEAGIPLQSPAPSTQAPPPPQPAAPKPDVMTALFLRGEPRGLGVVQVLVGLLCVLCSLTALLSPILLLHAPLCTAACFVVSGSLLMAAARRTTVSLVWASLVWNLLSLLLGLGGVAYLCWLLADRPASERFCDDGNFEGHVPTEKQRTKCRDRMDTLDVCVYGVLGLLLVLLVLQVCVNVTVCVFSCRALRHRDRYDHYKVEVEDSRALLSNAASGLGSDVSLLDSEESSTPPLNAP